MQRPRVDDPRSAHEVVASDVRMSVTNDIDVEIVDRRIKPSLMPMKHSEALTVESDSRWHSAGKREPDRLDIRQRTIGGTIRVPPDERQRPPNEFVKNRLPTNITAVNQMGNPKMIEQPHRLAGHEMVVMRI